MTFDNLMDLKTLESIIGEKINRGHLESGFACALWDHQYEKEIINPEASATFRPPPLPDLGLDKLNPPTTARLSTQGRKFWQTMSEKERSEFVRKAAIKRRESRKKTRH